MDRRVLAAVLEGTGFAALVILTSLSVTVCEIDGVWRADERVFRPVYYRSAPGPVVYGAISADFLPPSDGGGSGSGGSSGSSSSSGSGDSSGSGGSGSGGSAEESYTQPVFGVWFGVEQPPDGVRIHALLKKYVLGPWWITEWRVT
jgi:hypothetical protein